MGNSDVTYIKKWRENGIYLWIRAFYPLFYLTFARIMIVANMNLHEVYADLMGEMNKLDWKRDALLNKAVGVLRRSVEFPASIMYDYKMQSSKNKYIIYFYREHPFAPVLSGYLCLMFDGNKRYIKKSGPKTALTLIDG